MYNVFVCIVVDFRLQSYDFFSYVVSDTHGKGANMTEIENAKNQLVTKIGVSYPMENCR